MSSQSGEATPTGQERAADLRNAVLVARRDEPASSFATDLSNVVPFSRSRRGSAPEAPPLSIPAQDRAALPAPPMSLAKQLAVLAGSLAVHGSIFFVLWQTPAPFASIGIEAITVDVVLGGDTAAGLASTPAENEVQVANAATEEKPDEQQAEQAKLVPEAPPEVPVEPEPREAEPAPREPPQAEVQEQPAETPEQSATAAPLPEIQKPAPRAKTPPPDPKRIPDPKAKTSTPKQQATTAAPEAASGVGRGRSDSSATYNGRVSAHLARHKQYPAAARSAGSQGTATVSFSLDGGGRVTSARLAGGSGIASIDQEAVAMVRRASPFPAPPDGRGRSFTVPVRFNLR